MNWEPWIKYKDVPDILEIKEPPCKYCKFWRPQKRYTYLSNKFGYDFDGVQCCHADEMEHDFSCFRERKEEPK